MPGSAGLQANYLFIVLSVACATSAPTARPAAAAPRAVSGPPAAPAACAALGPLTCDIPPADLKDPCRALAACIEKHGDSESRQPIFVYRCEQPQPLSVPGTQLQLATLNVKADQGARFQPPPDDAFSPHPNAGSAVFLLGQHAGGLCFIDQLGDWDWDTMGRIEDQAEGRVEKDGQLLVVVSEHASRDELDQEEREEGVDDLREASCTEQRFKLVSGRFERGPTKLDDGLCPSMH